MKNSLIIASLFFLPLRLLSQHLLPDPGNFIEFVITDFEVFENARIKNQALQYISKKIDFNNNQKGPFYTFSFSVPGNTAMNDNESYSLIVQNKDYEREYILKSDQHCATACNDHVFFYPVYLDASFESIRIAFYGNIPENLKIHVYNPGFSDFETSSRPETSFREGDCEIPEYLERDEWCSDCPVDTTPEITSPTHLIVHHSAGANNSDDWPAVVRAIWDYHVNVRGWDDIGYNWLIDPEGRLYIGRADNHLGAHFCGTNSATMGTCLLGTYTSEKPSDGSIDKLIELLAWKSDQQGLDPIGIDFHSGSSLELNTIAAHRQGCSTECPGTLFFNEFDDLRSRVKEYMASECEEEMQIPEELSITPNPNHGFFSVGNPHDTALDLFIYSADGKLIIKDIAQPLKYTFLQLNSGAKGAYYLYARGENINCGKIFIVH